METCKENVEFSQASYAGHSKVVSILTAEYSKEVAIKDCQPISTKKIILLK